MQRYCFSGNRENFSGTFFGKGRTFSSLFTKRRLYANIIILYRGLRGRKACGTQGNEEEAKSYGLQKTERDFLKFGVDFLEKVNAKFWKGATVGFLAASNRERLHISD